MDNHLKVKTANSEFSVSGDTDFIEQAYDSVRQLILEKFSEATEVVELDASYLDPITEPESPPTLDHSEEMKHISFISCNDIYRKVYFVTPDELGESVFGKVLDFDGVQNVYLDRELQTEFEKHFVLGKALWRELTTAGRTAIRNAQ